MVSPWCTLVPSTHYNHVLMQCICIIIGVLHILSIINFCEVLEGPRNCLFLFCDLNYLVLRTYHSAHGKQFRGF